MTIGFIYDESSSIIIEGEFNRNIYKINEKDLVKEFEKISKLITEPNGDSSAYVYFI